VNYSSGELVSTIWSVKSSESLNIFSFRWRAPNKIFEPETRDEGRYFFVGAEEWVGAFARFPPMVGLEK
jgi:hypothetical protein